LQVRILRAAFAVVDSTLNAVPPLVRQLRSPIPVALLATVALSALHGFALWVALEGADGLTNGWPLWRHDHPLFFHYALVARSFLAQSWTTAGYDPTFMAGHAKSMMFPPSATLSELTLAAFGGGRTVLAYKVYVLVSAAAIPWLVAASAWFWRLGSGATLGAVTLFLVYAWSDFPMHYAGFGMLPYLLSVPLGLAATGAFLRYCEVGGTVWWLVAAGLLSGTELVHSTSFLIVAPAAAAVYLSAWAGGDAGFPRSRHLGVWMILGVVVVSNAFWWVPGLWLTSTKGPSGFAFAHPEGVLVRLTQVATGQDPIECWLWVAAVGGFVYLFRLGRTPALGLLTFAGSGFFFGYLAGYFRALDFLQPGRHTYALYTGLSVASGLGLARGLGALRQRSPVRLPAAAVFALVVLVGWSTGPDLIRSLRAKVLSPAPFLSSRPSLRMLWVMTRVKKLVRPGERLLYEEGGFDIEGMPDPYGGGRFSGLLPESLGIEVIGGPYLHAALDTNFTQFGEGKLYGKEQWGRDWFTRYARIYRPSAILCWSPWARRFCKANPDLIEIRDDDGLFLVGRVKGFGGAAIVGKADVVARPGRLTVTRAEGGLDGSVVLRYHSVPCLRTEPPVAWDAVFLEDDPVPFIRLRPPLRDVVIRMRFPP